MHSSVAVFITVALLSALPRIVSADDQLFSTSDSCMACHNGLVTSGGTDVSFGFNWRPSMMANAARDPYWQASVRREIMDHPQAAEAIQNECSACHMPMTRYTAKISGRMGQVFAHLPLRRARTPKALLAADGVSCSVCHQITADKLGTKDSFTAGFVVDRARRRIFGPHEVDRGRARVMNSATGFQPAKASHVQESEMCATCHTLFTHALGPGGKPIGTLPEQVPYLEWKHSEHSEEQSCQDCHMPELSKEMSISSVVGQTRDALSRHIFIGGNFFMPRLLSRHRVELGVRALPQELETASRRAKDHLASSAAELTIDKIRLEDGALQLEVEVTNLAGHKLPTAYPSRRAWLHVTVRAGDGSVLLESGAVTSRGSIRGNDNDDDPARFEPHHLIVDSQDKVQIFETIMADHAGSVTTGLLSGTRYLKDNRVLPRGFDKSKAPAAVAVHGAAAADGDFSGGSDRVRYRVRATGDQAPLQIEAELLYQPIGYRWAQNLRSYKAAEPARFIRYYEPMASSSSVVLARSSATWRPPESCPEQPAATEEAEK